MGRVNNLVTEMWIVTHRSLKDTARVRAFMDNVRRCETQDRGAEQNDRPYFCFMSLTAAGTGRRRRPLHPDYKSFKGTGTPPATIFGTARRMASMPTSSMALICASSAAARANAPIKITLSVDLTDADELSGWLRSRTTRIAGPRALTGEEGEGNDYRRDRACRRVIGRKPSIESIRKAKAIVVTRQPAEGKKLDTPEHQISMSGAVAALLWIDDQQKRVDTVTAMIKRGEKPASAIPAQPKAPVIVAAKPTKEKPPAKQPAGLAAKGGALCGESDPKSKMEEMYALGGGRVLYEFSPVRTTAAPIISSPSIWSARRATRRRAGPVVQMAGQDRRSRTRRTTERPDQSKLQRTDHDAHQLQQGPRHRRLRQRGGMGLGRQDLPPRSRSASWSDMQGRAAGRLAGALQRRRQALTNGKEAPVHGALGRLRLSRFTASV